MINAGIIGFGIVGSGTAKVLLENKDILRERLGFDLNLKRIADLDIATDRGIKIPGGVLTTDVNDIFNDPDIQIVVELIGGIRPAKDFILKAIQKGKHVVTANKALLATEGADIFAAAQQAGVEIGFEASVAGAIPIIKVMKEGLIANRIKAIYGIINGTCNYILSKMSDEQVEFADALKEAQALGYAEADPTFDIEGFDTAHKLTILATLAYSIPLSYQSVHREGISGISSLDISFASDLGYKVKLLAITKESDGEIELRVHPTMLPKDYLIAKVDGPFNAIYVDGDATGSTLYYGRGAGSVPTGSAVVSDIADIARNIQNVHHLNSRTQGFLNYFEKSGTNKGKKITIGIPEPSSRTVSIEMDKVLEKYPDIGSIFISGSKSYLIALYLEEKGLKSINLIGYDLLDMNVKYLRMGVTKFLIGQRPEEQTYKGIKKLFEYLSLNKVPDKIEYLPVDVVTSENVEFFLK